MTLFYTCLTKTKLAKRGLLLVDIPTRLSEKYSIQRYAEFLTISIHHFLIGTKVEYPTAQLQTARLKPQFSDFVQFRSGKVAFHAVLVMSCLVSGLQFCLLASFLTILRHETSHQSRARKALQSKVIPLKIRCKVIGVKDSVKVV